MTRTSLLTLAATTAVAGATYLYGQGTPVLLQPNTPGTQQAGHANISGRMIASSIQANDSSPTAQVIVGNATSTTGASFGGFFRSDSVLGRALYGRASATSGTTHGVWGQADSPGGRGVTGVAPATTGNATGVWGQTASTTGRGVYGFTTSNSGVNYGVMGQSSSANGFGVYSVGNLHATGTISGNGSGLTNVDASHLGGSHSSAYLKSVPKPLELIAGSVYPIIHGQNTGGSTGVRGSALAAAGLTVGVLGVVESTSGRGVEGFASATTGFTTGVYGTSFSTDGRALFGWSKANSGFTHGVRAQVDSPDGRAMLGFASNGGGVSYGVRGQSNSPSGYGVYSVGNTGASGTKSFRIDHPLDPENKYLLHYSSESPMPQNFYVGNVVTDAQGHAWVTLPDYFSEINRNFKYQLTVVDGENTNDFVMAKVATKIKDGRFLIRTNAPNTEVSWRVDADRNDLYVRNRPTKDVVEKESFERGRYQHPEFYGLGFERGMEQDERQIGQQRAPASSKSK